MASLFCRIALAAFAWSAVLAGGGNASEFSEPWKRQDRALVIDAYEYNPIDWQEMVTDKRIAAFINKASDGLPPAYFCTGDEEAVRLCKALWKRHAVAQELFQTRRTLAKALGLKWGAYHLGRPGNPIEQADNFLSFAQPEPDDLMAIDIEENNPQKWMSLADAEIFIGEIRRRTGRFPILYTNGTTAKHIADNREIYPLLSRLPLWYARYKPEIGMHFPKGNWQSYALWQFSSQANCNTRSCPYRVKGAGVDIDVNVTTMTVAELRTAWPLGGLLGAQADMIASVPVPVSRQEALSGKFEIAYASVRLEPGSILALAQAFTQAGNRYPSDPPVVAEEIEVETESEPLAFAAVEAPAGHVAAIDAATEPEAFRAQPQLDLVTTAAIQPAAAKNQPAQSPFKRYDFPIFLLKPSNRRGENFEDLFGRASEDGALVGDHHRPVHENRVSEHEIDELLVAPFRIVETERLEGRVLPAQ